MCHIERDVVVTRSIAITPTISGDFDLIETIVKCDFGRFKSHPTITNGELLYHLDVTKVLFAPRIGKSHWTEELSNYLPNDPMFVNGHFARHFTRSHTGVNLHGQLVKLFPHCRFLIFTYETPIERPSFERSPSGELVNQNLLDGRNIGGIVVTNCTLDVVTSRANETLSFDIDDCRLEDLKRLNMSHCFNGKIRSD